MTTFFQAVRGRGQSRDTVLVSIETTPNPEMNADGTHDLFGETVEEAQLPHADAIEWLVARGCTRQEATRMVHQVATTFMAQSVGSVPTTLEWELDQPVTRECDGGTNPKLLR
jgi:hypothetical protein